MEFSKFVIMLLLTSMLCWPRGAEAFVFISEIHADPKSGLEGDANGDGSRSTSQDEFVELFNSGDAKVDLGGWTLSDAIGVRHRFEEGSGLKRRSFVVIFGGGDPDISGINWFTASSGSLSLNNSGDSVMLHDENGSLIDKAQYGSEGGDDQSLVRNSPGEAFLKHSLVAESSGRLYSPGSFADGSVPEVIQEGHAATVPEPASLALFLQSGLLAGLARFLRG